MLVSFFPSDVKELILNPTTAPGLINNQGLTIPVLWFSSMFRSEARILLLVYNSPGKWKTQSKTVQIVHRKVKTIHIKIKWSLSSIHLLKCSHFYSQNTVSSNQVFCSCHHLYLGFTVMFISNLFSLFLTVPQSYYFYQLSSQWEIILLQKLKKAIIISSL